jgi:uncharacterized protein YecT (DUF1311 family)
MTRRLSAACLALLLLLGGGHAFATGIDCADPADQRAMTICAEQALQAADAELDAAYQALREKVSPEGREKLEAARQAWITYRDAQCAFDTFGARDGTIYPMVRSTCLASLTRVQIQRLNDQLDCKEGDLSCGNQ